MESPSTQPIEELPVTDISRIGPKLASMLQRLGIFQVKDLLFHFPYRYQDRATVVPLGSLGGGQTVLVIGKIRHVNVSTRYRRTLSVTIEDSTGIMNVRFFHFNTKQREKLEQGNWMRCFGEVRMSNYNYEMVHPEYSVYDSEPSRSQDESLTPVYRLTEGVSQTSMRSIVSAAFELCGIQAMPNLLPDVVMHENNFPDFDSALRQVHAPSMSESLTSGMSISHPSMRCLIFEELTSFVIGQRQQKMLRKSVVAPAMKPIGDLSKRLKDSLTFEPTESQRKVIFEIISDLKATTPMMRLLQGDVGSGKTLVAAAAVAWVVDCGYQAAIMAPTELLADQHFNSFSEWFTPLGVEVSMLTGKMPAKARRKAEQDIKTGKAKVVTGTHALFQEGVEFERLGLIIVDEQHRFGVGQRFALREKGVGDTSVPHQLILSATPIPRTLAMAFYASLDVSNITELPPGRIPVATQVVPAAERRKVVAMIKKICEKGQQVYWVCPIIEKSEVLDVESAVEAEKYVKKVMPELRIELIHGRLKSANRDKIMNRFREGDIDVLVATTVIEVGVDVPNASMMVIESADQLGLSQLHQLRGRVGRGANQAMCILMYRGKLSEMARKRLQLMRETNDGFKIAETDLSLRGAGELLGTRQTGAQMFRIAEIPRDRELFGDVRKAADLILQECPDYVQPLIRRWAVREGQYSAV